MRRGIDGLVVRDAIFSGSNGGSNGIKLGTASYGAFRNISIELANTGAAFFVYLAQQAVTHPAGDVPKLGRIERVSFTDIADATASWPHSPHQGSLRDRVRRRPPDGAECAARGDAEPVPGIEHVRRSPAWGDYLRQVDGVTFDRCTSTAAAGDARPKLATEDLTGAVGAP